MRYVVNNLEENEASESADVFIMLSVENDRFFPEQEAVGVAQEIGSVCSSNQGLRSAIVEYVFDNDLIAGYITAHEIGHLLGMSHDFDQEYYNENRQRNPRNDSNALVLVESWIIILFCLSHPGANVQWKISPAITVTINHSA